MKKLFKELVDSVADIKGRDGHSLLHFSQVSSKNENGEASISGSLPISLAAIEEKVKNDEYKSQESLVKDIVRTVKEAEATSNLQKHTSTLTSLVKQTVRAKWEQVKAEMVVSSGKRTNRSSSFAVYTEDAGSESDGATSEVQSAASNNVDSAGNFNDTLNNKSYLINGAEDDPYVKFYNAVASKLDEYGNPMIKHFYRLPTRRTYQAYYTTIKNPISFSNIRRKLIIHKYETFEEFEADMARVLDNAISYYPSDSHTNNVALQLIQEVKDLSKDFPKNFSVSKKKRPSDLTTSFRSSKPSKSRKFESNRSDILNTRAKIKQVYKNLKNLKDKLGERFIMEEFTNLPSKRKHPEYYDVVRNSVSLKTICENVKYRQYRTIEAFVDDLASLICNARMFNKPSSQIYGDTCAIESFLAGELGPYVSEAIKKRSGFTGDCQQSVPEEKQDLVRFSNYLIRSTDSNNVRLVKLCGLQKEFKELRQTALKFKDIHEMQQRAADMLKFTIDTCPRSSKSYFSAITLLMCMQRRMFNLVHQPSLPPENSHERLISSVFKSLFELKNEYNMPYIDSILEVEVEVVVPTIVGNASRLISVGLIRKACQRSLCKSLSYLQRDFFQICRRSRAIYPRTSEPYLHSIVLQKEFLKQRDRVLKQNTSYICSGASYGLRDLEIELRELSSRRYHKKMSLDCLDSFAESLDSLSHEDAKKANSLTGSPNDLKDATAVSSVRFHNVSYKEGDFVTLKSDEGEGVILMIRRLFNYQSNPKELVGNRMILPQDVQLTYNRTFAENELIMTGNYYRAKVRRISGKVNVVHASLYVNYETIDENNSPKYFYHTIYDEKSKTLRMLAFDHSQVPPGHRKRDAALQLDRCISVYSTSCPLRGNTITDESVEKNFLPFMDMNAPAIVGSGENQSCQDQIGVKTFMITKGSFFGIGSHHNLAYQVQEINKTGDSFVLNCRKYLSVDAVKLRFYTLTYGNKEMLQTNTFVDIDASNVDFLYFVMNEAQFNMTRPTGFDESRVFVCCSRYDEAQGELYSMEKPKTPSYNSSQDFVVFPDSGSRFIKVFPSSLETECKSLYTHGHLESTEDSDEIEDGASAGHHNHYMAYNSGGLAMNYSEYGDSDKLSEEWLCRWGDCRELFSSYHLLSEHFDMLHCGCLRTDSKKRSFVCLWENCPRYLLTGREFPTVSRLLRHVRDVHLKNSSGGRKNKPEMYGSYGPGSGQAQSSLSFKKIIYSLNSQVILLRDEYVANLIKVIKMQQKEIFLLRNQTNPLPHSQDDNPVFAVDSSMNCSQPTSENGPNQSDLTTSQHDQNRDYGPAGLKLPDQGTSFREETADYELDIDSKSNGNGDSNDNATTQVFSYVREEPDFYH